MKKYVSLGIFAAVLLLLLLLSRRGSDNRTQPAPEPVPSAPAVTNPLPNEPVTGTEPEHNQPGTDVLSAIRGSEQDRIFRSFNETANVPVAFYGQVVDQDTNPLQNVQVDVKVLEECMLPTLETTRRSATNLQTQTGPDGRFEVAGPKGHLVTVTGLTKGGYEPELGIQGFYGIYGAQSGSFADPVVFRMWSTNLHEPLISGEKSFVIVPDGRHYAIDLIKATIVEGDEGDLVAWIKRPDNVERHEKYAWSCELAVPGGGLQESDSQAMFTAPVVGYSNAFAFQESSDVNGWSDGFERKRFYVKVQRGQSYGRASVDLYAYYDSKSPSLIRISYAVNPSGSRLLR